MYIGGCMLRKPNFRQKLRILAMKAVLNILELYCILKKPNLRRKMRNLKQSHSAEKSKRDTLGFLNIQFVSKYHKIEGSFLETLKIFAENVSVPKKIERWDHSVPRSFEDTVKLLIY